MSESTPNSVAAGALVSRFGAQAFGVTNSEQIKRPAKVIPAWTTANNGRTIIARMLEKNKDLGIRSRNNERHFETSTRFAL